MKPPSLKQRVATRNIKAINADSFKETVSSLISRREAATFDALTDVHVELLDDVAPCKERTVTARPLKPWFNFNVKAAKREKRRAERALRKTGLLYHKEAYTKSKIAFVDTLEKEKNVHTYETESRAMDHLENCLRYVMIY